MLQQHLLQGMSLIGCYWVRLYKTRATLTTLASFCEMMFNYLIMTCYTSEPGCERTAVVCLAMFGHSVRCPQEEPWSGVAHWSSTPKSTSGVNLLAGTPFCSWDMKIGLLHTHFRLYSRSMRSAASAHLREGRSSWGGELSWLANRRIRFRWTSGVTFEHLYLRHLSFVPSSFLLLLVY